MPRAEVVCAAAALVLVLLFASAHSASVQSRRVSLERRKHLAGPPSEFASMVLPSPLSNALSSESASYLVTLQEQQQQQQSSSSSPVYEWTHAFPVDSSEQFTATVASPLQGYTAQFTSPSGVVYTQAQLAAQGLVVEEKSFGLGDVNVPTTTYVFNAPEVGVWRIDLTSGMRLPYAAQQELLRAQRVRAGVSSAGRMGARVRGTVGSAVDAVLVVFNQATFHVSSNLQSYADMVMGRNLAVEATTVDKVSGDVLMHAGAVQLAEVMISTPSGRVLEEPMHDEGAGRDLLASDGVLTASIDLDEAGDYETMVLVSGVLPNGVAYERTVQHVIRAVPDDLRIRASMPGLVVDAPSAVRLRLHKSGTVPEFVSAEDDELTLLLPVTHDPSSSENTYQVFAQVYGTNAAGAMVPVAWVGGVSDTEVAAGATYLPLYLNRQWLTTAGASEPLELRNVRVQSRESQAPLAMASVVPVKVAATLAPAPEVMPAVELSESMITHRMRHGPRPRGWAEPAPTTSSAVRADATTGSGSIMLVHGYCAGDCPFTVSQFTNAVVFEDYNANRNMDDFAIMIMNRGDSLPAFSIAAHSQGGLASTHLHAFYWSKLEQSSGGRRIQSVGSPYQGTALAGNLAAIGKVFGVGCGVHAQMTHDGAALWLSNIPTAVRQEVFFYYTQYATSGLLHYCNLAANAVLSWPNDGTTEIDHNTLPGGNFMGNVKGWCHSDSMHHPPQCTDPTRNAEINANAAR